MKKQRQQKLFFKLVPVKIYPHKEQNKHLLSHYLNISHIGGGGTDFDSRIVCRRILFPPWFLQNEVLIFNKLRVKSLVDSLVVSTLAFSAFGFSANRVQVQARGLFWIPYCPIILKSKDSKQIFFNLLLVKLHPHTE